MAVSAGAPLRAPLPGPGEARLLRRLDRALTPLEDALGVAAAVVIFAVMIGTVVSIGLRLAGSPLPQYLELSEQLTSVMAFAGVALAQRLGAHVRMELVIGALKGRFRWLLETAATFLGLVVILILIRYSWDFFDSAWRVGDTTLDYGFPTWPAKLLVPAAFSIWALRLTLELAGFARLLIWPTAVPVAVPLVKSAAEHAEEEIAETAADAETRR